MTNIEWCRDGDGRKGATWNPIAGCSVHTPGCTNCYAMKMAARLEAISIAHETNHGGDPGPLAHYRGLTQPGKAGPVWTGKIGIAPDSTLTKPLRWNKPRRIFVNSMSDLFHPAVPDEVIDRVFAVMALCPQHIFQLLTKRSARMREYLTGPVHETPAGMFRTNNDRASRIYGELAGVGSTKLGRQPKFVAQQMDALLKGGWPLPNVHLGVSVEDQTRADQRIPDLLATPAAVRWISAEPLLGPVDLRRWIWGWHPTDVAEMYRDDEACEGSKLDWVVCGGESGKNARPMHPDWARSLRDQCAESQVPFFFKQWGEWAPDTEPESTTNLLQWVQTPDRSERLMAKVGKKRAGRLLDGVRHDGFPA